MKGIILAGGSGTRLHPCTKVTSKQLLPIYNKPMIYYPLETLLKAGITEVLIIVSPEHAGDFVNLLGSGKDFGARFFYEVQDKPEGLAQAFLIGESFIEDEPVAMILGDNLFEDDISDAVQSFKKGARIFAKEVEDPQRFGVVEFDGERRVIRVVEKPQKPKSNYAVTGLYIYDSSVVQKARSLRPSMRGELEITDLNQLYLDEGQLDVAFVEGAWLDTGTFESMYEATCMVRAKELGLGEPTKKRGNKETRKTIRHRSPSFLVSSFPRS
ncbi:MAG: sugar phosphate nucleotidyltransferase [bacterium]|nr:sugar phosphate nucleotidyltransferase [bacterium]